MTFTKQHLAFALGAASTAALVAAFAFSRPAQPVSEKKTHRIVFQLSTPDTAAYRALTRQLNNVLEGWPDAQIEVVAHNKGIQLLHRQKSNVGPELEALQAKGVRFVACEQTLKQQKLDKSEIMPLAGFVERGLLEIVTRQEQGWAYIKAGF